ncbi:nuclear transport factor 2 family protein [Streptomyces sp. NPDC049837]|uniref:nuclear transport factor 2 family protein n=1 Tax=Streptomyces sp. NPDC049837 TaxID=3155277 RepID=UPI00341BAB6B
MSKHESTEVRELMRAAVTGHDATAMREAVGRLFGPGPAALSPEAEYEVRHPDYVMEMPQSGERIRGREAMRRMQEEYPAPPTIQVHRVTGSGPVWVLEGVNDYGGEIWYVVAVLELDQEGRILHDTRYYGRPFPPEPTRAALVEPMD